MQKTISGIRVPKKIIGSKKGFRNKDFQESLQRKYHGKKSFKKSFKANISIRDCTKTNYAEIELQA